VSGKETDELFKRFANFFLGLVPIFVCPFLLHSTPSTHQPVTQLSLLCGARPTKPVRFVLLSLALQNTCV